MLKIFMCFCGPLRYTLETPENPRETLSDFELCGVSRVLAGSGSQDYTHFYHVGVHFLIAQDICYTGFCWQEFFCVIRAPP